jgi:hypothetical protein
VLEVRTVVVCRDCRVSWPVGGAALCADAGHAHGEHESHRHRTDVELPDGARVTAVSFHAAAPYEREVPPDFGLYLDHRWQPPWAHDRVEWPDFGLPADEAAFRVALGDVLERARSGQLVEIGCLGAHGRTGTALACLAVLAGVAPGQAVDWVRAAYCDHAVETAQQAEFVARFDPA